MSTLRVREMTGRVKITPPLPEESWSEENLEVHPSVQLLVARMESNPEEFYERTGKATDSSGKAIRTAASSYPNPAWGMHKMHIDQVKTHWNRREKRLYNEALRKIRMEEYHQKLVAMLIEGK